MGGATILILNAAVPGIREQDDYTFKVNRDAQRVLVESTANLLRVSNSRIVFLSSPQAESPERIILPTDNQRETKNWLRIFPPKRKIKISISFPLIRDQLIRECTTRQSITAEPKSNVGQFK